MEQRKKMTGKGHTLFEFDLPQESSQLWVLIAESCYEISRTLIAEQSYADEIHFSLSGYEADSPRGGVGLCPEGFIRYPFEIFQCLDSDKRVHLLIEKLWNSIRRIQVRVKCEPFTLPLFYDEETVSSNFHLLENIRHKMQQPDIIGQGYEGLRKKRISTYTPKRSDEISRAYHLLALQPQLKTLLNHLKSYWHRRF